MSYTKGMTTLAVFLMLIILFGVIGCDKLTESKNEPPTCEIISPLNNVEIEPGAVVTIYVEAEDEDGDIKEVRFYINEIGVSSTSSFPFTYEWDTSEKTAGNYTIKVIAMDDDNDTAEDEITVTIIESAGVLTVIDSIPGIGRIPFGLTWDGEYFWHTNRHAGEYIFRIDPQNGSVVSSFSSPGTDPSGIAWAGEYLWHSDWSGNMIYKIDVSTGTQVFSFPMNSPKSVEWDGNYIWACSNSLLYKLDPTNGEVLSQTDIFYWVSGISFDGVNFWINGQYPEINGERKIYKMTQSGEIIETYDWPRLAPGGLSWDGNNLWVSDYNGWIYKMD